MKNKTLRYTSLSVLTLLTALTLVACGGKTDKNTSSSNQKVTTSKVTTESASKTEAGQKEEQKSETNSATEATTTQAEQKEDKQKSQEVYAKFVGTWENYAGITATVTEDGIVKRRLLLNRYSSCRWWARGTTDLYPSWSSKRSDRYRWQSRCLVYRSICKRQR